MPKYIIKYTRESWREVIVEADTEEAAILGFFNDEGVDWSTDHEYDEFVDYDNADVYIYDEERTL